MGPADPQEFDDAELERFVMHANDIGSTRTRFLLAVLAALALARAWATGWPVGFTWSLGVARDVAPEVRIAVIAVALIALAWTFFAKAPRAGARAAPWSARAWPWALALTLGTLLVALPDRVGFVGDFLIRIGILESPAGFANIFPQALPLDEQLNHVLPVRLAATLGVTPLQVLRAMGVLEAFALVALAVRFARLVTRSEAAAAAVATVIALGGYATFLTGYPKPTVQVALCVVATATLGYELVTRGRGAWGLALAVSLGLALHRGALPLVLPWLLATALHVRELVKRGEAAGARDAWRRSLPLAAPLVVLALLARPLAQRIVGFDTGVNFLPPEVQAQGGVLAAAFASTRLIDDLNAVLFHAPLAPLALVTLAHARRRREALYLASVVLAFLPILLFVHLPLGPFRDVDALGSFGAAVAVASAWGVARWLEPEPSTARAARGPALAVALSVVVPFLFVLVAATDLPRTLARAEAIVAGPPVRSATQRASLLDWIGIRAMNDDRFGVAREAFARLCEETPIPHALQLWGTAALLDLKPEEARRAFGLLVERAPAEPIGWYGLWMSAAATGDTLAAARASERALQWGPESREMRKVVEFFDHYPLLYTVLQGLSGVRDTLPAGRAPIPPGPAPAD